jgi:hypothetical protein
MIASFNISLVAHGTNLDSNPNVPNVANSANSSSASTSATKYKVPEMLGIYREVSSKFDLSVPQIVERIMEHQDKHEDRFRRKSRQVLLSTL